MTYCRECGTELNGARFCPVCGTPADETLPARSYQAVPLAEQQRLNTMDELIRLRDYFGQKQDQYFDVAETNLKYLELKKKSYRKWLIATIILAAIAVWLLNEAGIQMLAMAIITLIIPAIVTGWIYIRGTKKTKIAINNTERHLQKLERELTQHYKDYGPCPLGMEYVHPFILAELSMIVDSGRADTIKEALNTYLDDLHKARVESDVSATREAAESAAASAADAAALSAINLWRS